jgi:uncharacterized protein YdaT
VPWTPKSFAKKHNQKLRGEAASKASAQANAMIKAGVNEGTAIATASKAGNRIQRKSKMYSHPSSAKM